MKNTLTKPEWAVMSALWAHPDQTISGIIAAMGDKMDWKYNTYVTYVKRLCAKGFIGYNIYGRDNFYYPLIDKEQCIMAESESIIDKISDMSIKALLVQMIKGSDLSPKDLNELKQLIDDLNKEDDES